jgi:hypothetical protein
MSFSVAVRSSATRQDVSNGSVISEGGGNRARVLRQLLMIERRNAVGRSECVRGRLPLPQALRDELGPLLHARAVQHLDV